MCRCEWDACFSATESDFRSGTLRLTISYLTCNLQPLDCEFLLVHPADHSIALLGDADTLGGKRHVMDTIGCIIERTDDKVSCAL